MSRISNLFVLKVFKNYYIYLNLEKQQLLKICIRSCQSDHFRKTPKCLEIYATMAGITDFRPEIIRCFWLLISKNQIQGQIWPKFMQFFPHFLPIKQIFIGKYIWLILIVIKRLSIKINKIYILNGMFAYSKLLS